MFLVPARQIVRSGVRYFKTVEKALPEDLTAPLFAAQKKDPLEEGWKGIYYVGFGIAFGLAIVGLNFGPKTDVQTWAREEALVRMEKEENGEKVEMGHNYAGERKLSKTYKF